MEIIAAAGGRWQDAALELLIAGQPEAAYERADETPPDDLALDGLLAAVSANRLLGVAFYAVQSDRTGDVWPPVLAEGSPDHVSDALLEEVARRLDAENAWIGQSVLEPERASDRAKLARGGFGHIADLLLMECPLGALPRDDRGETPALQSGAFEPGRNELQFERVLAETYVGTLDCPGLDRWRTPREALVSHRLAGEHNPALWRIYCDERGDDVGLLLATAHSAESAREVVYMGVVPGARGRGFGRAMLRDALGRALEAGCRSMRLAVDARNAPARKLYAACGFVEIARRSVHARPRGGAPFRA